MKDGRQSLEGFKKQLEERTLQFSVEVLNFLGSLKQGPVIQVVVHQLAKISTSIGANYRESNSAESKADFRHKLSIVVKEASETVYWLEVCQGVSFIADKEKEFALSLLDESRELYALFRSVLRNAGKSS